MTEKMAPVDDDQARINNLNELQKKASDVIARKIGSQPLANLVIRDQFDSSLKLEVPKLKQLNPDNLEGYDGYTQEGIHYQPFPMGEGYIEENWKTDVTHYGGGCWSIKTDCGERKFVAFCNTRGEVEVKATLSLSECYYIVNDCRNELINSTVERFEYLAGYLEKLGHKGMVSVTFSSVPGKSEIHLPV
jgi:hypothetical protein